MQKILVCEDEDAIREFEVMTLKRAGYEVIEASCGEDAIEYFEKAPNDFSVVLLDIMMPGIDGFAVCKHIRGKNNRVGIIMLSAKTQEMDKVTGLTLGADDYITKPFSPSELTARVDAICRRIAISSENSHNDIQTSGPFTLNLLSRTLTKNGTPVDLTQVEFQLMELFIGNEGMALERRAILERIWGDTYNGDDKIVDVNIRRLRMKIEDEPSNPEHLQSVWGFGYKWMA